MVAVLVRVNLAPAFNVFEPFFVIVCFSNLFSLLCCVFWVGDILGRVMGMMIIPMAMAMAMNIRYLLSFFAC
jgi:hypothetical protein